jgi:tRNA A37 threonylcarbamoyladenosine dehydratase
MLPIDMISVAGPDIRLFPALAEKTAIPFGQSQDQAFGDGTTATLAKLRAGIVGLSGTGSPLLEQLVRLGFGEVVIIDPDIIEDRNLKSDPQQQRRRCSSRKIEGRRGENRCHRHRASDRHHQGAG